MRYRAWMIEHPMGDPFGGPANGRFEDIGSLVGGAVSLVGGVLGSDAAGDAAQTQADAANRAADLQWKQYQQTRDDLAPYRDLGSSFIPQLRTALQNPLLSSVFSYGDFTAPTAAEAAATPGYQFTLDQGLKAAQNSASARGLGASGAAMKGAEAYATGLADSTYGDTFNRSLATYNTNRGNALSNFGTNYGIASDAVNRLLGVVGNGQNASAMTGAMGAQAAGNVANAITSGAAASAAGTVGSANAINSGLSGAVNGLQSGYLLNKLFPTAAAPSGGSTLYGAPSASTASGYNIGNNSYNFQMPS
ncbi:MULTISPECIES: hypothetical protein [Burkholderia]|uniref:hypothetical protein n=1 Tax=Burkholderia TaxID=32008 RepID=UPI001177767C|nr:MULTISPECIES: hypothetical protein [Burkholderia]EKS9798231.1 hypothetical protein [Burkholderia cepacia]EKS9808378.1 hypothetical protein [Burkholderia cepacia]EKS9815988.1 hypothetical protein [Burkholderia cepacia]EKS9823582.1 hypothetical protein [Burkholderia cepacia]EKS9827310.1 hypothetical protein [Burkholderia cepacia]